MTSQIWRQILALLIWDMQCYCLKELFTRIPKPEKVLKYIYPVKEYNVLKFKFLVILFLNILKTQISKPFVFWLDRRISKFFSVLRSLRKVLSNSNITHPTLAKPKFGDTLKEVFEWEVSLIEGKSLQKKDKIKKEKKKWEKKESLKM